MQQIHPGGGDGVLTSETVVFLSNRTCNGAGDSFGLDGIVRQADTSRRLGAWKRGVVPPDA